jgi:hypothetical protein
VVSIRRGGTTDHCGLGARAKKTHPLYIHSFIAGEQDDDHFNILFEAEGKPRLDMTPENRNSEVKIDVYC